jgi:hypothetical protein
MVGLGASLKGSWRLSPGRRRLRLAIAAIHPLRKPSRDKRQSMSARDRVRATFSPRNCREPRTIRPSTYDHPATSLGPR